MSNVLEQLLTVPNFIFCIIIAVIIEAKNRIISYYFPKTDDNKLYQELILPLAPILVGGVLAGLVKTYPYPEMFTASSGARVLFGCVAGLASAHIYRIAKNFLVKKEKEEDGSNNASDS